MTPTPKVQRWIDLLAALLGHRLPVTFDELAKHVPAYLTDGSVAAGSASPTLKRMFERDKDELRALGVPIISIGEEGSDESAYQLKTKEFYLPYLAIVSARGLEHPPKVDRYGYRSLETLAFDPDELEALTEAARQVAQVGDPVLTDEARNAVRKLAFDLPLGATDSADSLLIAPRKPADSKTLGSLGDALFRRKRVSFVYHTMGTDADAAREVDPYGLFFVSGHWYLVARDTEKQALRNFRVSRIQSLKVPTTKAATPDYEIPTSFSLKEHSRSRQAWEIGDGDAFEAVVEFTGTTGAVKAAAALGVAEDSHEGRRKFQVRRVDSFARWVFSFGGDAVPVSPEALLGEYRGLAERTRSVYGS